MDLILIPPSRFDVLNIRYSNEFEVAKRWREVTPHFETEEIMTFCAHLTGSRAVLDVGCGWGAHTKFLLEQNVPYLGIDRSPKMLLAARRKNPQASFRQMSFLELKLPKNSFAGLWCCCAFNTTYKILLPSILRNLRDLLVDDGVMMVIMPVELEGKESVHSESGKPQFWHSTFDYDEMRDYLTEAGFKVLQADILPHCKMSFLLQK